MFGDGGTEVIPKTLGLFKKQRTIRLFVTWRTGKSPFIIGKPSINGPLSMAMLNNQRVDEKKTDDSQGFLLATYISTKVLPASHMEVS